MGDRISISFKNKNKEFPFNLGTKESITLFSHWDGMILVDKAKKYVKELKKDIESNIIPHGLPLERLEPNTVIIDFIKWYTKDRTRITSNLYLGKNKNDGDNSDNGHHIIEL